MVSKPVNVAALCSTIAVFMAVFLVDACLATTADQWLITRAADYPAIVAMISGFKLFVAIFAGIISGMFALLATVVSYVGKLILERIGQQRADDLKRYEEYKEAARSGCAECKDAREKVAQERDHLNKSEHDAMWCAIDACCPRGGKH